MTYVDFKYAYEIDKVIHKKWITFNINLTIHNSFTNSLNFSLIQSSIHSHWFTQTLIQSPNQPKMNSHIHSLTNSINYYKTTYSFTITKHSLINQFTWWLISMLSLTQQLTWWLNHCALTPSLSYPVIAENVVDRLLGVDSGPETIENPVIDAQTLFGIKRIRILQTFWTVK